MNSTRLIFNVMLTGLRPPLAAFALLALAAIAAPAAETPVVATPAAAPTPVVDPQADLLLHRMGDFLAQAQFYSVSAEVWQDIRLVLASWSRRGGRSNCRCAGPTGFTPSAVRPPQPGVVLRRQDAHAARRKPEFLRQHRRAATLDAALDTATGRFGITVP